MDFVDISVFFQNIQKEQMSLTSSVSSHNPIQSEIKRIMNGEKIGKSFLSKLKQTFRLLLFF